MDSKKSLILFAFSVLILVGVFGMVSAASDINLINPVEGNYYSGTINIEWSFVGTPDGPVRIEFNDGTGWTFLGQVPEGETSKNWDTDAKNGEEYRIYVYEPNTFADAVSGFFTIDNILPTSFADSLDDYQNTATFDIPFTITDANPDSVELYYSKDEGSSWTSYGTFTNSPIEFAADSEGKYEFYTIATDLAGNVEIKSEDAEASTTVDTIDPETTDNAPTGWQTSSVDVTLTCSDIGGSGCNTIYYKINGGATQTYSATITISTDGEHILEYWSVDNAGNEEAHKTANIKIDATVPNVDVTSSLTGLIVDKTGTSATISCTDDISGCSEKGYEIHTTEPSSCSETPSDYNIEDSVIINTHSWVCGYAKDDAGNEAFSTPVEFTIFDSIQDAIDYANINDEISIAEGTYTEDLLIDSSKTNISIIGKSKDNVIIDVSSVDGASGCSPLSGICVLADDVTLQGFTVSGGTGETTITRAIKLSGVSGVTVSNVKIEGIVNTEGYSKGQGFDIINSNGITLSNLEVIDNGGAGFFVKNTQNIAFSEITTNNNLWGGIALATDGDYSDPITTGITFSGTNSFGELALGGVGIYLEIENGGSTINYSNDGSSVDVDLRNSGLEFALHGIQDDDPTERVLFFDTLDNAKTAGQIVSYGHLTGEGRYIEEVSTNNYYVEDGMSVQAAIDNASVGATINVAAGGYDGFKIEGKDNLEIVGEEGAIISGNPVIHTVDTNDYQVFVDVVDSTAITIGGLTIDANSISGTYFRAIYYSNSDGIIQNNIIKNINIGGQKSSGIWIDNGGDIEILDNIIDKFGKGGIVVYYATSVQIEGNTITTIDHSIAPNGIQIGYLLGSGYPPAIGITGTISDNKISGCSWEGYDGKGYDNADTGSGILIMDTTADLDISYNEVHANDVGIDIEAGSLTTIQDNNVHDNAYGFVSWNEYPSINYNTIKNNNEYGIFRTTMGTGTGTLNATDNWWGTTSVTDSMFEGDVDYTPWAYDADVNLDHDSPTSTVISPAEGSWHSTPSLEVSITDEDTDGAGLQKCRWRVRSLNGDDWSVTKNKGDRDCSQPLNLLVGSDSSNYCETEGENACKIEVWAIDNSGNDNSINDGDSGMVERTFSIDFTDPTGSISVNSGDAYTESDSVTLTLDSDDNLDDNLECRFSNDASTWSPWESCTATKTWTLISGDGSKTVSLEIRDDAGNVAQFSDDITLDTQLPQITGLSDFSVAIDDSISVTATITDEGSGVDSSTATLHYSVNEAAEETNSSPIIDGDSYKFTIPASTSKGTVTYYITAEDNAGNEERDPESGSYTITVNDLIWNLDSTWNLVSVPKELVDDSAPENEMWYYDPTETDPENKWKNPTTIEPSVGYWVNSSPESQFGIDYAGDCTGPLCLPSGKINIDALENSWNLIGLTSTEAMNVSSAFSSDIFPNENLPVFYVINYNETTDSFNSMSANSTMIPGEGYWVYVDK